MKKIVAIFLVITMAVIFSCCNKDQGDDNTTLAPYIPSSTADNAAPADNTTAAQNKAVYILTTDPNQTVYWGATTMFMPTEPTAPSTTAFNGIIDDPGSTAYNPQISQASTTATTASNSSANPPTFADASDNTDADGNLTVTDESTTASKRTGKGVTLNDRSFDPDNNLCIYFSPNGWDSQVKANSCKITVNASGSSLGSAKCELTSDTVGGLYCIRIYTSELPLYSGASVTVTIPEGFIETMSGNQYNYAFTATAAY